MTLKFAGLTSFTLIALYYLNVRPNTAMKVDFDISEVITARIHSDLGDFAAGWVWNRLELQI